MYCTIALGEDAYKTVLPLYVYNAFLNPGYKFRTPFIKDAIGLFSISNLIDLYLPSDTYEVDKVKRLRTISRDIKVTNVVGPAAREIASHSSLNWEKLDKQARNSAGRLAKSLLGSELKSPSKFLIAYAPDGGFSGSVGLIMRIAADNNILTINLAEPENFNLNLKDPTSLFNLVNNPDTYKTPIYHW